MDRDAAAGVNGGESGEARARPFRARSMVSETAFADEQAVLGKVWSFLGYDSDIPNTNDWFRTMLGGRSIFVQRFKDGIRAFENRCAHRFYPLRTADKGRGPVVCGYHHWRYNDEGLALGVPLCVENYGKTPRELNARLSPVELAFCGSMIFGRFPGGQAISLQEWLGPGWHILSHLAAKPSRMGRADAKPAANWKLLFEISLDDYHIVAIHPTTFGKQGYLPLERIRYFRFGAHSAFCPRADAAAFDRLVEDCRTGVYRPNGYRIFQFFPNLLVVAVHAIDFAGDAHWYILVQNFVPVAAGETKATMRFFRMPFHDQPSARRKLIRAISWPTMTAAVWLTIRKIVGEDNIACEKLQSLAGQVDRDQLLARQEARIAWFDEEYRRALGDPSLPAVPPAFETFAGKDL